MSSDDSPVPLAVDARRPPTLVVAAGVIRHAGRVLVTRRRAGAHLAGLWEFPGGKLEPGESPTEALVRECREECALEVTVGEILEVTFHRYEHRDVLLLFYACDAACAEVRHLGVDDHAWLEPNALGDLPLPPGDEAIRRVILARAAAGTLFS